MAQLRKTVEFQADEQVLRVDCLGNLVDDMSDKILVGHADMEAFRSWLDKEIVAFRAFENRRDQ